MKKPLVSIILTYYRKRKYIKKTIKSIQNQSYKNFQLICVYDDTDKTDLSYLKKLIATIKIKCLIVNKKNLGVANSRNIATKHIKGKYTAFIDADDLWKKDKLSFVEVNIGSQRLHRLTRIYENRYLGPMYLGTDGPNILMILPAGEIHTLGLITASGIFKKYGANPYIAVGYKLADIISLIESKPFKIVGISVSNTENLDNAVEIAKIIKSSIKQKIPLILGGHSIKTNKIKKARLKVFDLVTANPEEVLTAYDVQ